MAKVSVCIPTYNRSHYLTYAVNSVLNQTYSDFELIICDDGSPDNTPEVVAGLQDNRIRYIRHEKNIGRSRNMRSGFEASQGDYFIKFDDDDALTPEFLEKTVKILDENSQVDFVCSNHWIIDKDSQRVESATKENTIRWGKDRLKKGVIEDLDWQTFYYQSLQVGSTLFRYSCLKEVDYMDPKADGCEDFDLLVRLALINKIGYFLPEYLMEYRFHGGQTSLGQNLHFLEAKVYCIENYQFPDQELEEKRKIKLAQTQQNLGLRFIEKGQTSEGRELLTLSKQVLGDSKRTNLGLLLSYLPLNLRQLILKQFRQLKPKDYTEKVRSKNNNSNF
ncbi:MULTISPECIES: glycosyltransferase family 2 protein [Crocosphaera]|uniref:Glycosyltransferase PglI n=3 Tax=Crocosphaera watsonii TaxID=263511 RepID=T2JLW7_CROWT|nr:MULTISPECIES: glycosyltransferase family 2 protein [Crocosphaera]EHJ11878.1 Glycosyl transferase, family 2 [Crocosphaera watsonii WH 0003]MCH2244965.1 glycosyltransferase [Crocosphaera sp.]NQZ64426.1 glycosyltransferase family 2 protein [Crocosphaera sp.]CCQ56707.1 Glycosyltransferase PglI [Crocosphaera watsonii WH 0005]CCQ66044.1 Glycosyltransferase PglI [Crocosphaera watsonii WH 0402]